MSPDRRPSRRAGAIALVIAAPVVAAALAVGLALPGGGAVNAAVTNESAGSAASSSATPQGSSGPGSASDPTSETTASSASDAPPSSGSTQMMRPTIAPEGQAPRPDSADSGSGIKALVNVKTDDPVIFITIDDGMYQDPEALKLVEEQGIPITAFLTEWTTHDNPEWFTQITSYGGSIQNHSMTHANLNDPKANVHHEICATQRIYADRFGAEPWMLRPPYGEGYDNDTVQQVAEECGINRIIMWNVTVAEGGRSVEYWDAPLRPGDIVLTHFDEDLHLSLQKILDLAAEQGLTPAPLEDYV